MTWRNWFRRQSFVDLRSDDRGERTASVLGRTGTSAGAVEPVKAVDPLRQQTPSRTARGPGSTRSAATTPLIQGSSAFGFIANQVTERLRENDWRTVAITSPTQAVANTLTAINLAARIARSSGTEVLLVEMNLERPMFRTVMGFTSQMGVADYLQRDVALSEIEMEGGVEGLIVIPAGQLATDPATALSSPRTSEFIRELKLRHQRATILFDTPSILASEAALAFCLTVDCTLLLVEEGGTRMETVKRALSYLKPTRMLGLVINQSTQVAADPAGSLD